MYMYIIYIHVAYEDDNTLGEVLADVESLGLVKFSSKLPADLSIRQVAAMDRFLQNLGLPDANSNRSTDEQHSNHSKAMQQLLKAAGVQTDDKSAEEERLKHKANVGQLAKALQLGLFSPLLLPDKPLLDKVATSAQLGHFPDFGNQWDDKHDRPFAKGLLSLLQTGVAALLHHRVTPAALFSELAIALELALEPRMRPLDAERAAISYTTKARKLLHDSSLNAPLLGSDPATFQTAMNLFLRRDTGLYTETREGLAIDIAPDNAEPRGARSGKSRKSAGADQSGLHCLRYSLRRGLCPFGSECTRIHRCPFCDGRSCRHEEGGLCKHLADLKVPSVVVEKRELDSLRRGPRQRSMSRSRGNRQVDYSQRSGGQGKGKSQSHRN